MFFISVVPLFTSILEQLTVPVNALKATLVQDTNLSTVKMKLHGLDIMNRVI